MANDRRSALEEEIRFIKKQEWYVATAAITLIGALYAVLHTISPTNAEKVVATVLVTLAAACASNVLVSLHDHLSAKRKDVAEVIKKDPSEDPSEKKDDPNPWRRGVEIPIALVAAVVASAAVVIYAWWRTAAC